jgi:hypothetical protein
LSNGLTIGRNANRPLGDFATAIHNTSHNLP